MKKFRALINMLLLIVVVSAQVYADDDENVPGAENILKIYSPGSVSYLDDLFFNFRTTQAANPAKRNEDIDQDLSFISSLNMDLEDASKKVNGRYEDSIYVQCNLASSFLIPFGPVGKWIQLPVFGSLALVAGENDQYYSVYAGGGLSFTHEYIGSIMCYAGYYREERKTKYRYIDSEGKEKSDFYTHETSDIPMRFGIVPVITTNKIPLLKYFLNRIENLIEFDREEYRTPSYTVRPLFRGFEIFDWLGMKYTNIYYGDGLYSLEAKSKVYGGSISFSFLDPYEWASVILDLSHRDFYDVTGNDDIYKSAFITKITFQFGGKGSWTGGMGYGGVSTIFDNRGACTVYLFAKFVGDTSGMAFVGMGGRDGLPKASKTHFDMFF
jgi:hypothetical protein